MVFYGFEIIKSSDSRGNGAPKFSNGSKVYLIYAPDKKKISQVAYYNDNNEIYKRMDWEHEHKNFKKGIPHIQYYETNYTRNPNEEELKLFNKIKENNFYENYKS